MLNQVTHSDVDTNRSIYASDECTIASIKSIPDETKYYTEITMQLIMYFLYTYSIIHGVFDMYDSKGKKELSLSEVHFHTVVEKCDVFIINRQKRL